MKIKLNSKKNFIILLVILAVELGILIWQSIDAGRFTCDLSLALAMVACVCCIPSCFETEK